MADNNGMEAGTFCQALATNGKFELWGNALWKCAEKVANVATAGASFQHHAARPTGRKLGSTPSCRVPTVQRRCGAMQENDALFSSLGKILEDAFQPPANRVSDLRGQYILAFRLLAKLIEASAPMATERLQLLAISLWDLEHGSKPPLLLPKKAENRPIAPTAVWYARARAVLAIEFLTRAKMSEQAAVELIVKTCPNLSKALSSPGDDLKTSIPNWRNILRQKSSKKLAKNRLAAEIFEEGLRSAEKELAAKRPEQIKQSAIAFLVKLDAAAALLPILISN
jgi:hypothetical protein